MLRLHFLPFRDFARLFLALVAISRLHAQGTYTVTSTADTGATGTLRWAVTQANANPGSTINLSPNLGTITLGSSLPIVTASVTINGGSGNTLSGGGQHRILFVDAPSASVSISGLTLANGFAKGGDGGAGGGGGGLGAGGAIFVNTGAVTVSGVSFANNAATGGAGGTGTTSATSQGGGGGGGGLGGDGGANNGAGGAGGGGGGYGGAGGSPSSTGGGGGGGVIGNGGNGGTSPGGGGSGGGGGGLTDGSAGVGSAKGVGGGGGGDGAGSSGAQAGSLYGGGGGGAGSYSGADGGKFGGGGGAGSGNTVTSAGNGGDFGGGGGNSTTQSGGPTAGNGGFGGGGGGGSATHNFGNQAIPGSGGFGGGSGGGYSVGAPAGTGYLGGHGGKTNIGGVGGGGGGGAAGGVIFVRPDNGASLTILNSDLDAGSLTAGAAGAGYSAQVAQSMNGTLATAGSTAGSSLFLGGGTTIFEGTGTSTIAGGIAEYSVSAIEKSGPGTLILSGANTYTGGTTLNAGTLRLDHTNAIGTSGTITFTGGTLQFSANNTIDYSSRFSTAASQAYKLDTSGQDVTLASALTSPDGTLTKLGAGTLTLSGNNTYSGGTTLVAGILAIGGDASLGTGTLALAGGTLRGDGTAHTLANALTLAADSAMGGASTLTFNGLLTNAGADHTLTLTNSAPTIFGGVALSNDNTGRTLTFAGSGGALITGVIANGGTGAGSLVKTGSGTLTLSGVNTYTGGTTVAAGTLTLSGSGTLGADANALALTGGMLDLGGLSRRAGAVTFAGGTLANGTLTGSTYQAQSGAVSAVLAGSAALTKSGAGTLALSGANTYTGGTTIAAGTLTLSGSGTLGADTNALTLTGGTLDLGGLDRRAGATTFAGGLLSNGTLTGASYDARSGTVSAVLAGSGALAKTTAGTLTLSGNNTYTGGTTLSAGTLALGSSGALGTTGNISFTGGTLQFSANNTTDYSGRFSPAAGQAYKLDTNSQDVTLASALTSPGGTLTKLGAGTLTLSGSNTFDGGATLSGGTLALGSSNALGSSGTITFDGGTLQYSAGNSADTSSRFSNAAGQSYKIDTNGQNVTLATPLSSAGGTLGKSGSGTLTLAAANTFDGTTTITGGALQVGNGGNTGSLVGDIVNHASLVFNRSDTATFSQAISGTGTVTHSGVGTLNLSGTNTYSGGTTIGAGTLGVTADANLGAASGSVTFLGGTLSAGGSFSSSRSTLLGAGGGTFDVGSGFTFAWNGDITGAAGNSLTKIGAGTLVLGGNNTYSGDTLVNAGTLRLGSANAFSPNSTLVLAPGASFDTNGFTPTFASYSAAPSGTDTFTGIVAGSGGVTMYGTGTLVLAHANTYTGTTTVSSGTLRLGAAGALPSGTNVALSSGATLDLGGYDATVSRIAGAGAVTLGSGTLTLAPSVDTTFSATLSGSGSLIKSGTATLILDGTASPSGGTSIANGTLQIGSGGTSGSLSGNISNHASLVFNRSDTVTFSNVISGDGTLTQSGAGTLRLSGANTYSGGTTLNAGTLALGHNTALGTSTITINGGEIRASGAARTLANPVTVNGSFTLGRLTNFTGPVTLGADATITANNPDTAANADSTLSGVISGAHSLTVAQGANGIGTGAIVFSGANTYSGGTTVSSGRLRLSGSGSLGTGALTVNGGELAVANSPTLRSLSGTGGSVAIATSQTATIDQLVDGTYSGAITGSGRLAKTGSGVLTLAGANTYSGGTTLSAGTLALGSSSALGSSGTIAFDGGTLRFSASNTSDYSARFSTVAGQAYQLDTNGQAVALASALSSSGGSLNKTGTGTLTLNAANTFDGTTTITGGTLQVGNGGNTGSLAGDIVNHASLVFNRSDTATFSQAISGTGTVTHSGVGTLNLSGTNTYSGGTTIGAGTLGVTADANLGAASGSVTFLGGTLRASGNFSSSRSTLLGAGGGTFDAGDGSTFIWNGNIAGAVGNSLTKIGAGTLVLGGNNTYSGDTLVNAGTLRLGAAGALPTGTNVALSSGATLDLGGHAATASRITGTGAVTLGSGTLTLAPSVDTTFSATLSGNGSLIKSGTATLILDGTASPSGGTTIANGTLRLSGSGRLGDSSAVSVASGATFDLNGVSDTVGSIAGAGNVTLGAGTLTAGSDNTSTTFSGILSGTGALVKSGTGTLTLSGSNTHSGGTTLAGGRLVIASNANLGDTTAAVTFNGGTLAPTAGVTATRGVTVSSGGGTFDGGTFDTTFGALAGSGTLNKLGNGTLTFADMASFTGTLSWSEGTVRLASGGQLTVGAATLSGSGAFLNDGSVILSSAGDFTLSRSISGSGSLTKSGSGVMTFSDSLSLTGGIQVEAGTLRYAGGSTTGSLGPITGAGALVVASGTLALTASNTFAGGTTLAGGTLQLSAPSALSGALTLNGGTLVIGDDAALQNVTGPLVINGGGIRATGALRTVTQDLALSGSVVIGRYTNFTGNISLGQDSSLLADNPDSPATGDSVFSGVISGPHGLTIAQGPNGLGGPLVLSGANTFTGGTTVQSQLGLHHDSNLGTGSLTLDGGQLLLYDAITSTRTIAVTTAGGTFRTNGFQSTFAGISGDGSFTLAGNGGGSLSLTGSSSLADSLKFSESGRLILTHTATLTTPSVLLSGINTRGLLTVEGDASSRGLLVTGQIVGAPRFSGVLTLDGGIVRASAPNPLFFYRFFPGTLVLGSGGGFIDSNGYDIGSFSGFSGSGGLTKLGSGTLTLDGDNNYTGGTTIVAGTLMLGSGNTSGSLTGNITNNASLVFNRSDAVIFADVISGTGGLTKSGTGRLTLTGTNTYSGATSITGGEIKLNGSAANSAFTLSGGGALSGTGHVGSLTVASGGTISPGNSPGTMFVDGAGTLAGGGSMTWEINRTAGTAGADPGWDLLSISGALNITATSGSPFTINLTSLTLANSAGTVSDFSATANYSFTFVSAGSISGFDTNAFALNTSGFTNPFTGTWSIGQSGSNLTLNYTGASAIPEPSTYAAIAGLAALALAAYHRRRRA